MSKQRPRVRVKMRREGKIRIGGVAVTFGGYARVMSEALEQLLCKNGGFVVHETKLLIRDGDYDRYRVIYS